MLPSVTAIMLVNGRTDMVTRAVESFMTQTYPSDRRHLIIWDTGDLKYSAPFVYDPLGVEVRHCQPGKSIGFLRNSAIAEARGEIIVTFDSDDVSHECRIEEQVALLSSSGKAAVGYRELLFWDTRSVRDTMRVKAGWYSESPDPRNEAWLYSNSDPRWLAGASMCYWRRAWEACPFDDAPHEDQRWWLKNAERCLGVSSLTEIVDVSNPLSIARRPIVLYLEPRLICQMHAGGTEQIPRSVMESGGGGVWKRAEQWDAHASERMRL